MTAAEKLDINPRHRDWTPVYANQHATVLMHEDHRSKALVVPSGRFGCVSEMAPSLYRELIKVVGRAASSLTAGAHPSARVSMSLRYKDAHEGSRLYFALQSYELG